MPDAGQADVLPNGKDGTLFTSIAHIFCAVVGAGVLGLPNSVSWLGWVAGPLCLIVFFAITLVSSLMLTRVYCVDGIEFARYHHAVEHILGKRSATAVSCLQVTNLFMVCIAYSITGAISMQAVANLMGSSFNSVWQLVLLMGAMELVLSQLPSLAEIWWVSTMGCASSLGFVTIALILGLIYSGNGLGSVGGRAGNSSTDKAINVLGALGNIAFAFSFALVLLEIQDTLRQPPTAVTTMTKSVYIAFTSAFTLYFSTAVACYSALGNGVPGQVLTGFDDAPNWLLIVANIFVVIHMITAWQVFSQPIFETIESNIKAFMIKKQQGAAGKNGTSVNGTKAVEAGDKVEEGHKPSPFDVAARPGSVTPHQHHPIEAHHLSAVTEGGDMERGQSGLSSHGSDRLRRRSTARSSGSLMLLNSAPIPDLLPVAGWKPKTSTHGSNASLAGMDVGKDGSPASALNRKSVNPLARLSAALGGSQAMYHLDTGAANEHVPMNDQGYYLPIWQRLLFRSIYVLLVTIVAACMPFFSAVTSLVGAIMFWPLSIAFPFAMYAKVYKPGGIGLVSMKAVAFVMLLVGIVAAVASFRSLIVTWNTYQFFS